MTSSPCTEELVGKLIKHVISSDNRPNFSEFEIAELYKTFNAFYSGEGFRALYREFESTEQYQSWSLSQEGASKGAIDCHPIGSRISLLIYHSEYIEGLEVLVALKNIVTLCNSFEIQTNLKKAIKLRKTKMRSWPYPFQE